MEMKTNTVHKNKGNKRIFDEGQFGSIDCIVIACAIPMQKRTTN